MTRSPESVHRVLVLSVIVTLVAGLDVSPADAATYTPVGKPAAGEPSWDSTFPMLGQLQAYYDGAWVGIPGTNDYTNGAYTAKRLNDGPGTTVDISTATAAGLAGTSDQVWSVAEGTKVSFTSIGKWSGAAQQFGFYAGDGSGGKGAFTALGSSIPGGTSKTNTGFWLGGWKSELDLHSLTGGTFRWASDHKTPSNSNDDYTSRNADNPARTGRPQVDGGTDRVISYLITKSPETPDADFVPHFLLFFEDGGDFDFNDLVVEVNAGPHYAPSAVPVPPLVIPALVSLAGCGLAAIRKRR